MVTGHGEIPSTSGHQQEIINEHVGVSHGDPLTKAQLWLRVTPNASAMTVAQRINRDFMARCSSRLEDMLAIHNADLMCSIQRKEELIVKIANMRVQLIVYELKAYYTNEAKREAMTLCQQMISFFQQ